VWIALLKSIIVLNKGNEMRRVEEFLAEKLNQNDFAEAFWAAEAEQSLTQQIDTVRVLRTLRCAELLSLPHAWVNDATPMIDLQLHILERSPN
jgi:hypothetical protein